MNHHTLSPFVLADDVPAAAAAMSDSHDLVFGEVDR
jgi:hypothetical protein